MILAELMTSFSNALTVQLSDAGLTCDRRTNLANLCCLQMTAALNSSKFFAATEAGCPV